jgi:hypothetical protein
MADKTTKWILELVDQVTAPLKGIEREAQLATSIGADFGDSFNKSVDDVGRSLKDSKKDFIDTKKSASDLGDEFDQSAIIYTKLGQKLHNQGLEAAKTARELDKLAKEADQAGKAATKSGDDFKELGADFDDTSKLAKDFGEDVSKVFKGFRNQDFGAVSEGLRGIAGGFKEMAKAALAFMMTPVGIVIAGLAAIALVTTDFVKYNEAARETNIIVAQITQTAGDALSDARIRAETIEKTFGKDFKQVLEVAKNNVQAFGITYNEAFDDIQDGLLRGGMASDEFIDSMREYPRLFANSGFTMKEFQRIVNTGIDMGIYSDKLPDAIKEFGLSVKEQTQSSRDALENAFGKQFTDTLFNGIKDGSITVKDALIEVAAETERVGVNAVDAQVLTADLFRGAGEDAGGFTEIVKAMNIALLETPDALTAVETHLNSVAEANLRLAEAKRDALESDSYVAFAAQMGIFWTEIKIGYYEFLTFLQTWFDNVTGFFTQLIAVVVSVPTVIKNSFNNVMEDLGLLVSTFLSAGSIIDDALHFRWDDAKEGFKNFSKDLKEDLLNLGKDVVIQPGLDFSKAFNDQGKNVIAYRELLAFNAKNPTGLPASTIDTNLDPKVVKEQSYIDSLLAKILALEKSKKTATPKTTGTGSVSEGGSGRSSGGGSGRSITMTLNIVQNFAVNSRMNIEEVASETVRLINDRLRDAVITTAN